MYYNGLRFRFKGRNREYNHNKKFMKLNKPKYAFLGTKVDGYRFKSKNNSKNYCFMAITNHNIKIRNFNTLYKASSHSFLYTSLLHQKDLYAGFLG